MVHNNGHLWNDMLDVVDKNGMTGTQIRRYSRT